MHSRFARFCNSRARFDFKSLNTPTSLRAGSISNVVALLVSIVVGFLLVPYIIRHLGQTDYGVWTLVSSFIGYYGLLNFGVQSAISRYVAYYTARAELESLSETVSTAVFLFALSGVMAAVLTWVFSGYLAQFLAIPPEQLDDFTYLFRMVGLATGLGFMGGAFGTVLVAREYFLLSNVVRIALSLLHVAFVVIALKAGLGLAGLGWVMLIEKLMEIGINFSLSRAIAPEIRIHPRLVKTQRMKLLWSYGGITVVIAVADLMRSNLDSVVITKWVGLAEVGIYGIALMLVRYQSRLVSTAMGILTPRFSKLFAVGDHAQIEKLFLRSLGISAFISFLTGMMIMLFGGQVILLWVGGDFVTAIPILLVLASSSTFAIAQNPGIGLMYAMHKHHFYALATMFEALANLGLSLVLVQKYGMMGVALGTMVPMLIVKVIVMPLYVSRILQISLRDYVRPMSGSVLVSGLIVAISYYCDLGSSVALPLYALAGEVAAAGLIYIAGCYFLANADQRRFMASLLSRKNKPSPF